MRDLGTAAIAHGRHLAPAAVTPIDFTPGTFQRNRISRAGFTLIELLVAISILAIVAVLGWRGLDGIVRARIALTANLDQTRAMQLTFAQMQSDCSKIIDNALVPEHAPLVADQSRLMMVRTVYADDQPSRLQVVTYRIRNGNLTRRESLATRDLGELANAWQSAAADADAEQALVLQSDVMAMTVRLWQGNGGWRLATGAAQGTPATPALPAAAASAPAQLPPGVVAPLATTAAPASSNSPAGLEVSLPLRGRSTSMIKIFLVGAV